MMPPFRSKGPGLVLFRLELLLLFRQRFVAPALLVFAVLCLGAASEGLYRIAQQRATIHRLQDTEAKRLLEAQALATRLDRGQATAGPFRDPRVPSNFVRIVLSTPAVKPLRPASVVDAGQADLLPFYFMLNTGIVSKTTTTYEYGNPQQLLLGRLDLSLVLIFLLPLFLAVVGYRIGSFEREAGIAPLLQVSNAWPNLIYSRRLALAATPLVVVYLVFASGAIWMEAALDHAPFGLLARSLFGIVALTLLYTAFWIAAMLLIARHSQTSSAGLLRISLAWTTLCLLIPAGANQLAASAYPTLSRPEYINRVRAATGALTRDPHLLYARYLDLHPERASAGPPGLLPSAGAMSLIIAEVSDRAAEEAEAEVLSSQTGQQRIIHLVSFLSPAMLTQRGLDQLAGEDSARQRAFLEDARQHVGTLRDYYRDLLAHDSMLPSSRFEILCHYPHFAHKERSALLQVGRSRAEGQ